MLYILIRSGVWAWSGDVLSTDFHDQPGEEARADRSTLASAKAETDQTLVARHFAIPQIVLAILALTSYHVQIITRLSSGYPVWYWWLASLILDDREISFLGRKWKPANIIARWMVIYAIVQGGLFASFLPPA